MNFLFIVFLLLLVFSFIFLRSSIFYHFSYSFINFLFIAFLYYQLPLSHSLLSSFSLSHSFRYQFYAIFYSFINFLFIKFLRLSVFSHIPSFINFLSITFLRLFIFSSLNSSFSNLVFIPFLVYQFSLYYILPLSIFSSLNSSFIEFLFIRFLQSSISSLYYPRNFQFITFPHLPFFFLNYIPPFISFLHYLCFSFSFFNRHSLGRQFFRTN